MTKSYVDKLNKIAENYTASTGFEKNLTAYKIKEIKKYIKGKRFLDIGCGEGMIARSIYKKNRFVLGIDGSDYKIKMARKLQRKNQVEYKAIVYEKFSCLKKFDCAIASNVLEHVDSSFSFLKKTNSILKSNGRLIVTVPNALGLHKRIGKKMGLLKNYYQLTKEDYKKGHKRIYDRSRLEKEIKKAGFIIKHSRGILLKPLPHKMMEKLDNKICDAFYEIGNELPDYCSSLIVVADKM